ncbi:hypothetical protein [Pseudovibrio brasiliensis]|uniref:DUF4123 domain-containing protein n=1 Tax=Pseudovibrio brasiliensis TaxID=1898042 RepID=A0ABX8AZB7_9HYPH|nr:hypothetical protein [Pseudovibrio brasiliensis]QUS59185.1 hypothetical protein KGB56_26935 [Pseudovibrio brasiliensis]
MEYLGYFEEYKPENAPENLLSLGVVFYQNEQDQDFYELIEQYRDTAFPRVFVLLSGDFVGAVVNDLETIAPAGAKVFLLEEDDETPEVSWRFVNGVFVAPSAAVATGRDVSNRAETLINAGTQIEGVQFKTDEASLQRLRELIDAFKLGLIGSDGRSYHTAAGDLLTFKSVTEVEQFYSQALLYRSSILERSADMQQLDPIPDPSKEALWDVSKTLSEVLSEPN